MPPKKHTRLPIGRYKPKKITPRKRKNTETFPFDSEIDIGESESDELNENSFIDESLEDDLGKPWSTFTYNCYMTTYYQIPGKNRLQIPSPPVLYTE